MKKVLTFILVISILGAMFTGLFPMGASAEDESPYYEAFASTKLVGFGAWGDIAKTDSLPIGMTMGNKGKLSNTASGVFTLSPAKGTSGNTFTAISPLADGSMEGQGITLLPGNPFADENGVDLSKYDGIRFQVNSKSITQNITFTIGATGTDHDFTASVKFKYSEREANNNFYLFFDIPEDETEKANYKYFVNDSDSSVGITDDQLKEINYIKIDLGRTNAATGFFTMTDLSGFTKEGGVSYTKVMAEAASKRWAEYTSTSWKAFKKVYDQCKSATSTSQKEKYAILLEQEIANLVPLTISSKRLPGIDNWTEEDIAKAHVKNGTMQLINDPAIVAKYGTENSKQVIKVSGKTDTSLVFQNYRPNTTSFTRMPSDIFGGIAHTGYTGIRFYLSSEDYSKFKRYDSKTNTTTGFNITVGGNSNITTPCEQTILIDGAGKGDEYVITFDGPGWVYIPFTALNGQEGSAMPNPGYIFRLEVVLPSTGATFYLSDFEYYKKETNDIAVNLSDLADLIGEAQSVDEYEFSATSIKALENALLHAQTIFNSDAASVEDVDAACKRLRTAIDGLEKGEVKYVNLNSFSRWEGIADTPGITLENCLASVTEDKAFIATEADFGIRFKLNRGKTNFSFSSFNGNAVYNNPFGSEYKYISGLRMYVAIENEEFAKGKYLQLALTNVNYTWVSAPTNSTRVYDGPGWYYWQISDMVLAEKYAELKVPTAPIEEQRDNERAIMSGNHEMIPAPDAFTLSVNISGNTSIYISELGAYQKLDVNGNPEGMESDKNAATADNGRDMTLTFVFALIALAAASALLVTEKTAKNRA